MLQWWCEGLVDCEGNRLGSPTLRPYGLLPNDVDVQNLRQIAKAPYRMKREYDFKIPEGPPKNYDPENPYADRVAFLEMKEYLVRRKMVEIEKVKIIRQRMRECYQREGVNHVQNCREIVELYWKLSRNANANAFSSAPGAAQTYQRNKFAFEK